jgi:hypothetical protein
MSFKFSLWPRFWTRNKSYNKSCSYKLFSTFRFVFEFVHVSPRTVRKKAKNIDTTWNAQLNHLAPNCCLPIVSHAVAASVGVSGFRPRENRSGIVCWVGCSVIDLMFTCQPTGWVFLITSCTLYCRSYLLNLYILSFVRYYDTFQAMRYTPKWSSALWATVIMQCFVVPVNAAVQRTLTWTPVRGPLHLVDSSNRLTLSFRE